MTAPLSPYIQKIQACQEAIIRIRRARAAGDYDSPAVAADFSFVLQAVTPIFWRKAQVFHEISPLLVEEAFETMLSTLQVDICKTTYPSLEQQLGARIKSIGQAVLGSIRRKHSREGRLLFHARFDALVGDEPSLADTIADTQSEAAFAGVETTVALAPLLGQLSPMERWALELKYLEGKTGVEIAEVLGVSEATVSRLLKAATTRLSRQRPPVGE